MVYAPPSSPIFYARHEGFTRADHYLAAIFDEMRVSNWLQTDDARKPESMQEYKPEPTPRPGLVMTESPKNEGGITVGEYLAMAGYTADWGEGD